MPELRWRKPSYSDANGACIELAHTRDRLRDSKNPGPELSIDVEALLVAIRSGRLG